MTADIIRQIDKLKRMTVRELRVKYREVYGEDTKAGNKDWLWKRIAWRIQELQYGGLSERAKKRAAEIVNEADLRIKWPSGTFDNLTPEAMKRTRVESVKANYDSRLPPPGNVLTREYQGRTIVVTVLEKGFEYEGEIFKSLSAVAREITGTRWNGYLFFNLK
jgi:Protein of unknown function (DUF2924)